LELKKLMVTFAPENAPELKFTVSWLLDANFCIVTGAQATTAQLYPSRDTFEFDQGHVTKN